MNHCNNCGNVRVRVRTDCDHCNGVSDNNGHFGINPNADLLIQSGCLSINDSSFLVEHPQTDYILSINLDNGIKTMNYNSEAGEKSIPLSDVRGLWA